VREPQIAVPRPLEAQEARLTMLLTVALSSYKTSPVMRKLRRAMERFIALG